MKRILVTGASGFVGSHLVEYLASTNEYEVFGTSYGSKDIYIQKIIDADHIFPLNLLDEKETLSIVEKTKPNFVVHLAALSSPGKSFEEPEKTIMNNVVSQINLFEALLKLDSKPTTLIVGSAEEYGRILESELPINESANLNPLNPYAVSKITQDYLGLQYFLTHGLPVIRIRPFNHTGERRPPTFVLPAFAKQVAQVEAGQKQNLEIQGDLSVIRDFTDVKDIVRAYVLALDKCKPGEVYNLGSGNGISINELLDLLLSKSNTDITVVKDETAIRPADIKKLVCDPTKFKQATGWEPRIPFDQTVERVLNYWRQQVKGE